MDEENIKRMEVCQTCGALLVSGDAQQRIDEHMSGKQHVGYARIREYIETHKKDGRVCLTSLIFCVIRIFFISVLPVSLF